MILKEGDYLDLTGISMDERVEIQKWLESKGNGFVTTINYDSTIWEMYENEVTKLEGRHELEAYSTNNRTQELLTLMSEEKEMKELPEEFIVTNADNLAVRQWLKDLGYTWNSGQDLTYYRVNYKALARKSHCSAKCLVVCYPDSGGSYQHEGLPMITPKLSVTGFDISYPTPEKSAKDIEIENMERSIMEMQESLKKLKEQKED